MWHTTWQPQTGAANEQKLTAFSFLFCLIMLERTLARDCPSLSNRYAGTAPSGVLSSFFCLVFLCSCIFMLQHTNQNFMNVRKSLFLSLPVFLSIDSRFLHLDLLCMSLFVVQFGLQTNQLPGFVRPLMSLATLLLPFLFMVIKAIAMPLAM